MRKENVHVKSSDSVANLIPILKSTFIASFTDQSEMSASENHSYVALVQGESKYLSLYVGMVSLYIYTCR